MAKHTPTQLQVLVLLTVIRATRQGNWYRAASSGQRVTLASLYRHGYLTRRAWRGVEGEADAAHEYQATAREVSAAEQAAAELANLHVLAKPD